MKAISLTQPWATLVAIGAKRIETRGWYTKYRGRIAIHAAKGFPPWARELCSTRPFINALNSVGMPSMELPLGAVIATVDLWQIHRITEDVAAILPPPEPERSFGDYSPLRYAWYLRDIRAIDPIPYKGQLRIFEVDI